MGRRHARNASQICETAVFDVDADRVGAVSGQLKVPGFVSLEEALGWRPDGVVVATPTHTHLEVARAAVEVGADVLIEKPISNSLDGVEVFLRAARELGRRVFVACNMRFHPAVEVLRGHLGRIGQIYFARAQYGNYLPDMRPGVDYKTLYCSNRAMGGGVILDAIHEIDYLIWFFGGVASVLGEAAKLSSLDIDTEDYACIVLRHENGVRAEIHLDYLQVCKRRGVEISGDSGTLIWLSEGKNPEWCQVKFYDRAGGQWQTVLFADALNAQSMYEKMLREFTRALTGESVCLLEGGEAAEELAVALAARNAAENAKTTRPSWKQ